MPNDAGGYFQGARISAGGLESSVRLVIKNSHFGVLVEVLKFTETCKSTNYFRSRCKRVT